VIIALPLYLRFDIGHICHRVGALKRLGLLWARKERERKKEGRKTKIASIRWFD
jgi:hypothetical protein